MMRKTGWIQVLAVSTAVLLPQALVSVARAETRASAPIVDVALGDQGTLQGQVVTREGRPAPTTHVALSQSNEILAVARTDADGRFQVQGLKAGIYQVEANQSQLVCRLWAPRTAPPAAHAGVQLVDGQSAVVRGQQGGMINLDQYGPALRGAVAGGLITGLTYWALDYNDEGS